MQHILIENLGAFEQFSARCENGPRRVWYTSSPWLLEYLPTQKEEVVSIEAGVEQSSVDNLGMWVKELTRKTAACLDETSDSGSHPVRVGEVLMPGIRRMLFPLLYKYFLLRHWVDEVKRSGGTGAVLGSPVLEIQELLPSRLDTLYAVLAGSMALPDGIRVIETPRPTAADLARQMKKTGTSGFERLLLLMNMDLQTAFLKFWRIVLKERPIHLPFRMRSPEVVFVDDCELSEEMLFHLFLRGCRLRRLRMKKGQEDLEAQPQAIAGVERIRTALREWLREGPADFSPAEGDTEGLSDLILQILAKGVRACVSSEAEREQILKAVTEDGEDGRGRPKAILTNAFSSSFQRSLFPLLRAKQVPVFACEHGVTGGLCLMNEHWIEENHLRLSDYCLCYSQVSEEYHHRVLHPPSKAVAVGMPDQNRRVRRKPLQKTLGRRALGLQGAGRVTLYVSNLYHNNYAYSPGGCSDHYYHQVKKKVVYEVLGKTKDRCLLKLYPTFRYAEEDPFLRLMVLPPNVKPVQFIEYRYLRAVGDVVLCDSPQSTLGWVWSTGVPMIYLDLPSNPLLTPVAEAFDRAVFRIDCSREDWAARTRELLLLPPEELKRRWDEKKRAREATEEKCIFGPPGKAAKKAARLVVDEALRRHSEKPEEADAPLARETAGTGRA